jgi:hypothetical protein
MVESELELMWTEGMAGEWFGAVVLSLAAFM